MSAHGFILLFSLLLCLKFPVILKKISSVSWHFPPPPFRHWLPSLQFFFSSSTLLHYAYSQCNTELTISKYVRSGLCSAVIPPGLPISCRKSKNPVLIVFHKVCPHQATSSLSVFNSLYAPFTHSFVATLVSFLCLKHTGCSCTAGPLHSLAIFLGCYYSPRYLHDLLSHLLQISAQMSPPQWASPAAQW